MKPSRAHLVPFLRIRIIARAIHRDLAEVVHHSEQASTRRELPVRMVAYSPPQVGQT
jgi:hypothetical protein